jgi:hypothetical protein
MRHSSSAASVFAAFTDLNGRFRVKESEAHLMVAYAAMPST